MAAAAVVVVENLIGRSQWIDFGLNLLLNFVLSRHNKLTKYRVWKQEKTKKKNKK